MMRRWERWLWGGCAALFGLLLFLPSTGRIVRLELGLACPTPQNTAMWCVIYGSSMGIETSPEGHQAALGQIRQAVLRGDQAVRLTSLELLPPDQRVEEPVGSLTAAQCATLFDAESRRLTKYDDFSDHSRYRKEVRADLPYLNRLIGRALVIEPHNGYFQLTKAVMLADGGEEDSAVGAVVDASRAPEWNDHLDERSLMVGNLLDDGFGYVPMWLKLIYEPSSQGHVGDLRDAIRQRILKLEAAGKFKEALQIRLALSRIAGLIRTQQDSFDGWFEQQVMLGSATARKRAAHTETRGEKRQAQVAFYQSLGLAAAAEPIEHEQAIHDRIAEASGGIYPGPFLLYTEETYRWLFGTGLLVLFLILSLLGAGGRALRRTAYVRDGVRVPGRQLWWIVPFSALVLLGLCGYASWQISGAMFAMIWGIWLDGPPLRDDVGLGLACGLYPAALGLFILFAIGTLIFSVRRKRPYLSTFVRTANTVLPVVAAVTLIGYSVELHETVGTEATAAAYQRTEFRAGMRTAFEQAGRPWLPEYSAP